MAAYLELVAAFFYRCRDGYSFLKAAELVADFSELVAASSELVVAFTQAAELLYFS